MSIYYVMRFSSIMAENERGDRSHSVLLSVQLSKVPKIHIDYDRYPRDVLIGVSVRTLPQAK